MMKLFLVVTLMSMVTSYPVTDSNLNHGNVVSANKFTDLDAEASASLAAYEPSYSAAPASPQMKTIYVNMPPQQQSYQPPTPVAAGPPRKHYKIVFIRAPAPPQYPQPILPPQTEQKTLIYVLHQRHQQPQQQYLETPSVTHKPEVHYLEFDDIPSAEELQKMAENDMHSLTSGGGGQARGGYGGGGGSGGGLRSSNPGILMGTRTSTGGFEGGMTYAASQQSYSRPVRSDTPREQSAPKKTQTNSPVAPPTPLKTAGSVHVTRVPTDPNTKPSPIRFELSDAMNKRYIQ